jgi:microcystin-dependent protein
MSEKYTLKYTGNEMDGLLDNANSLSGIIVMWSGAINKIPTGWLLCDGTNGTPDLRDRFIVGAGSVYSVGNTGGTNNVVLTEAQMPNHSHTGVVSIAEGGAHMHYVHTCNTSNNQENPGDYVGGPSDIKSVNGYTNTRKNKVGTDLSTKAGTHSHTGTATINAAGSGAAHENRPPYYALAYIMKV